MPTMGYHAPLRLHGYVSLVRYARDLAKRHGHVDPLEEADGNPSFATIMKVAQALGLRLHFESVA